MTSTQRGSQSLSFYYARRARTTPLRRLSHPVVPTRVGVPAHPGRAYNADTCPPLDLYGPIIEQHVPVVPSKTIDSMLAALDKRCNYRTDARCHTDIVAASFHLLDRLAPRALEPIEYSPDLFRSWVTQFPTAKRLRLEKAHLLVNEITHSQFSDKEIFVKMEALLKRHDKNWAPRIINQSSDIHNALLGPIMQKCTQRMFQAMDLCTSPDNVNFMGAYKKKSEQIVDHLTGGDDNSVFLSADFTANDSSQVKDVHLLEVAWLRRFGAPLWVTSLMLVANAYTIKSRAYRIRMKINNQLPTGSQSTTFRNSMWNATIAEAFSIHVDRVGVSCILGDDNVMRLDKARGSLKFYRRSYDHVCKMARMVVKVTTSRLLEGNNFLSRFFVRVPRGIVMIPNLGKALLRFNVCPVPAPDPSLYMAGKALSYAYEFRHFRAISKLYMTRCIKELGDRSLESLDISGVSWNVKGLFHRLGVAGILAEVAAPSKVADAADFTAFTHPMWGITAVEYYYAAVSIIMGVDNVDVSCLRWLTIEWM